MCDENLLLVGHRALIVPLGHRRVEVVFVHMRHTVPCRRVGIYNSLYERVACQTIAAMQSRARALAYGIQPLYARTSVKVHLYAAAHVVGRRSHGYVFLCYVDAYGETLLVYVREMVLRLLRVFVRNVEANMVYSVYLHLLVDGTRNDVARRERQAFVVFLHERLARGQAQYASVAAHRLGNEICGVCLTGMIERRRVKLYELHVLHRTLGTIYHGFAVAGGNDRICRRLVHGTASAGAHQRHLAKIGVHLLRVGIEHVCPVAFYVGSTARHRYAQMMLRYNLHGKVVFLYLYIGIAAHGVHQSALYLGSGIVGMVQYAELRVPAFTVQVERTVGLTVEVHSPLHQFGYLSGSVSHHLFHCTAVAYVVAGNHRVFDVLVEIVDFCVCHRGNASLCKICVGLIERGLAYYTHLTFMRSCNFQGVTHTGNSCADNQKVVFKYHKNALFYGCKSTKRNEE